MSDERSKLKIEDCLLRNEKTQEIKGVNYDLVAEFVTQDAHFIHIIENKKTYLYSGGVYCAHAHELLSSVLYELFSAYSKEDGQSILRKSDLSEIQARIDAKCGISISALNDASGNVFNAANGTLNLDTLELFEPSPSNLILTRSPAFYDPEAECRAFMGFLEGALPSNNMIDSIGEMIGFIIWPHYQTHKAFMFYGPKRTGKGTTTRVIEALVGANDCSHVSLQDLAENRFARARLFGKKLNTYGDLPAIPIKDTGVFKNLTGQDTIDAENKFEQIFSFRNRAKLLYSANRLPMLKYEDDAFYNRWIIIPFENSIYGREDPDLTSKLTTPTELSGILNFGLKGLERLRSNNWHFSYGETESGELYRRASNALVAFLEDMCVPSDGYVVKAELVKAFNEYARNKGLPPARSNKAFGIAMQDQMIIPVETKHPEVGGRQVEAWSGISLSK